MGPMHPEIEKEMELLVGYVFLFCSVFVWGCERKERTVPPGPFLLIDEPEQYSELRFPGDSCVFTFKLTNNGQKTLTILNVQKSCGCLSVEIPSMEIHPGKSHVLSLKVSQARFGVVSQSAILETNETRDRALHKLEVTTEILPQFVFNPAKIFEELYPHETKRRVIKAEVYVNAQIKSARASATWIKFVSWNPAARVITVDLSAESVEVGEYNAKIAVCTDWAGQRQIAIPVRLRVKSPVSVLPEFLFLGNVQRGSCAKPRFVAVSVLGESPGNLEVSIEPAALLGCRVSEEAKETRIYVYLVDRDFAGYVQGRMKIQTEARDQVIEVPIRGYVH
jgi:hypothetical protein